jgi:uncharacterized membrane protein
MKWPNIDAARRLDRLLRLQFLSKAILLIGWLMIILGGIAVSMTVRRTPDQLTGMPSANPKLFLTIMPWMPAPPHFRILGVALLILGIALASFATMWSRETKSRTAA